MSSLHIETGRELLATDLENALDHFIQACIDDPKQVGAWLGRGSALRLLKRHDEALSAYERVLTLAPDDATAWYERADCLDCLNRLPEALESYENALKFQPTLVAAWVDRSQALTRVGRNRDALASLTQALAIDPRNAVAWFNRAEQETASEQHEAAIESYGKFLEYVAPTAMQRHQHHARVRRVQLTHHLGHFAETLEALSILGNLDAQLTWIKGSCELATGKPDLALATLEGVPNDHAEVWVERALAYERLKRLPEAIAALMNAPESNGRRWMHQGRMQPATGVESYAKAVENLLAAARTRKLDRLRAGELAFAKKKLAERDPVRLAQLEGASG